MAIPSFNTDVSNTEARDFELPTAGLYPAMLIAIIDLGTHDETYGGKTSKKRQLQFVWELTSEVDSNGETFVVAQSYTWSLHKKSKLRPLMETLLGRELTEEQFNPGVFIGKPCMVSLQEGLSGNGKKYVEVSGLAQVPKNMTVNPATRQLFGFVIGSLTSSKQEPPIPDWVPFVYGESTVEKIKSSDEFQALPPF